jgi:3-phenylpropionate/trans-cinnamate dioxygenase ferredoxin reductase subunit
MSTSCQLLLNGRPVTASKGLTLLDAALGGAVLIPFDCRSGQCESCRVAVVSGEVDGRGSEEGRTVLACQAVVAGDAEIAFEPLPMPEKRGGVVSEINPLSPRVVELVVTTSRALDIRPGQYVRVKFAGFPAREYSPTVRLDGSSHPTELVFHIRRYPDGAVSRELGGAICPGTSAHVQGPFGQAYLRKGTEPLILVAGGTGWAPIWALARQACAQRPRREMVVIAGSRHAEDLYMRRSLDWLQDHGVREVAATAQHGAAHPVRAGLPSHYLPLLGVEDTVYVAGPAGLVDAVKGRAHAVGAKCYTDAFLPSEQQLSMLDRFKRTLRGLAAPGARASGQGR